MSCIVQDYPGTVLTFLFDHVSDKISRVRGSNIGRAIISFETRKQEVPDFLYTIMMSQTGITKLPEEMLVKIFSLLPPQDMKSVILVCKSWRGIGEDPTLWAWSVVEVNSREDFHK